MTDACADDAENASEADALASVTTSSLAALSLCTDAEDASKKAGTRDDDASEKLGSFLNSGAGAAGAATSMLGTSIAAGITISSTPSSEADDPKGTKIVDSKNALMTITLCKRCDPRDLAKDIR